MITLYFSEKPIIATEIIPFIGTKNNRKTHTTKTCPALKKAKTIHKIRPKGDFDVIPCKLCWHKK